MIGQRSGRMTQRYAMTVLEESRAIARLADKMQRLYLEEVPWDTYQAILNEVDGERRRFRHTYDQGRLEIMTRSSEHEIPKELFGLFLFVLAEEMDRPLFVGGETTLHQKKVKRGIEPDQCYWIANESRVRGKIGIEFRKDPPPDVFLEVEVSRTIINRLMVLAALRVPEVWRFDGKKVQVGVLQRDGQYQWGNHSPSFPGIAISELGRFLQKARNTDHMAILREFRRWVREQLRKAD